MKIIAAGVGIGIALGYIMGFFVGRYGYGLTCPKNVLCIKPAKAVYNTYINGEKIEPLY